ncbi:alpha/beta fold hydrolase [Geitlerinema sp. PCC 7407]|uniref:alpha/beta fold hydrolase n=1 Tax=Geitlerinema sp. PCC 7407 TaxID=1173025 RepID=UPI00029FE5CA|nr:alpha/beta fold hydrolase [Geitlerinema sp. PCC 7407]AFY66093.1 alpha/beta hydrolase fold protein [Geitlerinema sp. PCC 7407]
MKAPSPLAIAALDPRSEVQTWQWRGMPIAYQSQGDRGPAIVLIHGFGASWGHWRKNIPALAVVGRVFALDLLGFGKSAKPDPQGDVPYTFETWSQQIRDFCQEVVGGPAFLVGNSIGCIVAMQAAVDGPELVRGVALLNCSLRLLHDRRRSRLSWPRRVGAPLVQRLFTQRWLGAIFFRQLARPNTVRKILQQAYYSEAAVTDELVEMLMEPAADPGAVDVFLAFTRYSQGPLPEDLLEVLPCPALLLWGESDPWEPIELGRSLANYPCVENFIPLRNAGHCPQDEIPEVVNPILQAWILQKSVH